ATYYGACDLVMFPYRVFLSSSGPLSLAFSLGCPILLSENLSGYLETRDMLKAREKNQLEQEELLFTLDNDGLVSRINDLQINKSLVGRIQQFSKEVAGS